MGGIILLTLAAGGLWWLVAGDDDDGPPPNSITLSNGQTWAWEVVPHTSGSGFVGHFGRLAEGFGEAPIWLRAPDDPYPSEAAAQAAAEQQIRLRDPETPAPRVAASGQTMSSPNFRFGDFQWGNMPVQWRVLLGDDGLYFGQVLDQNGQPALVLGSAKLDPRQSKLLTIESIIGA